MNPLLLGRVLKEELKKTTTADPNGDANPQAEESFEKGFSRWVLDQSLGDDFFLLNPEHLTDGDGFIDALRHELETPFQKAIFQRISPQLRQRIEGHKRDEALLDCLLRELNVLLSGEQLIAKEAWGDLDAFHQGLLREYESRLSQAAINRLCLESIFSEWILRVWDTIPVSLVHKWIHDHRKVKHNALCLSGGGIRSATFGLGVLQGLAERGILNNVQYLSTVSGGGYIGSWLSAWTARENFETVSSSLGQTIAAGKCPSAESAPEPEEVRHLREYSNYLTPRLGIGSVDTWTLIATYLRNLMLNWFVFIPALALVLMVPRFCVALCRSRMDNWLAYTALIIGFAGILVPLIYAALHRPSSGPKKMQKHGQTQFLIFCFGPMFVASTCFSLVWAWLQHDHRNLLQYVFPRILDTNSTVPLIPFLALGIGSHLFAWILYFLTLKQKSPREILACSASGAVGGVLLWMGATIAHRAFNFYPGTEWFACFACPWFLASFLIALFLFVGLTSNFTTDDDREWWARMAAWSLIAIVGWTTFSVLILFGPTWLMALPRLITAVGGITGIITLILSHSGATPANLKEADSQPNQPSRSNMVLAIAAPAFIACFIAALSLGTTAVIGKLQDPDMLTNAARLAPEDIVDFPSLAALLKVNRDEKAVNLWKMVPMELREQILDFISTGTGMKETRVALANTLNGIIQAPATQTLDSDLSSGTNWLGSHPEFRRASATQQLWQHNRLMLQEAFPSQLKQSHFDHGMITHFSSRKLLLCLFGLLLLPAIFLSVWININRFSLHAIYRNRLIRAYLGASNRKRNPNRFTGFDPEDNLAMCDLKCKPLHVVNLALNLVSGEKLAWQQRKAENFTATPLHAGCRWLGYRDMKEYASGRYRWKMHAEMAHTNRCDRSFSLGTAVTISGAAASPNMGYHSSPVLAFLMTLFNVRLGAWFGNPGPCGSQSFRDRAPKLGFWHLVREAFGMTGDRDEYVYLSDGGHFENLGLYEMVLRRCRTIVVSDAGCDPNCALEDLGNAIRKIRIDLGIPIDIEKFSISSRKAPKSRYCAIGTIRYSVVDAPDGREKYRADPKSHHDMDGTLVYIKPAIAGDEPKDVFNYAEQSLLFPHEPTSDQWFSESQFESYRALGYHIVNTMSRGNNGQWDPEERDALEHFKSKVVDYLTQTTTDFPDLGRLPFSDVVLVGKAAISTDQKDRS